MKQIWIVSYEDTCRSRMAKEILKDFGRGMEVTTAGVIAGGSVPEEVDVVMQEHGLEVSRQKAKALEDLATQKADFIITLCPEAEEKVKSLRLSAKGMAHLNIADPLQGPIAQRAAQVAGTYDELYRQLYRLYRNVLSDLLMPTCTCGANTYCRCE